MPEPLTMQLVTEQLAVLLTAFPSRHSKDNLKFTAEVYRNGLRGVSGDALRAAVDLSVKMDNFFPKVARLRELATEWQRRNAPTLELPTAADDLFCVVCKSRAEWRPLWKPKIDRARRNAPVLTADGQHLLLETTERLLCRCAPASYYAAIDGVEPPMMAVLGIPLEMLKRAVCVDAPAAPALPAPVEQLT